MHSKKLLNFRILALISFVFHILVMPSVSSAQSYTSLHTVPVQYSYMEWNPHTGQYERVYEPFMRDTFRLLHDPTSGVVMCGRKELNDCPPFPENMSFFLQNPASRVISSKQAVFVPPGTNYLTLMLYAYSVPGGQDIRYAYRYGTHPYNYSENTTVPAEQVERPSVQDIVEADFLGVSNSYTRNIGHINLTPEFWGKWFFINYYNNAHNIFGYNVGFNVNVAEYTRWYASRTEEFWRYFDVLQPDAPQYYTFPHLTGAGGWQTDIDLLNTGQDSLAGQIEFMTSDGVVLVGHSCDVVLVPNAGLSMQTCAEPNDSASSGEEQSCAESCLPLTAAYGVLESVSDKAVGYTTYSQGGEVMATVPLRRTPPQADIRIPHIRSDATSWTGLALVSARYGLEDRSQEVHEVVLETPSGEQRGIELQTGEHIAFTISSLFDGQPQPDLKTAMLVNSRKLAGLQLYSAHESDASGGTRQEIGGTSLSSGSTRDLIYPRVDLNPDGSWPGLRIYNTHDRFAARIDMTAFAAGGALLMAHEFELQPQTSLSGLPDGVRLPTNTAWVRITSSNVLLTGFTLVRAPNSEGPLVGLDVTDLKTKHGFIPKLNPLDWGVASLININDTHQSVTLHIHAENGAVLGSAGFGIPANGRFDLTQQYLEYVFEAEALSQASLLSFSSTKELAGVIVVGPGEGRLPTALPALSVY